MAPIEPQAFVVHFLGEFVNFHHARLGGLHDIRLLVAVGIAIRLLHGGLLRKFIGLIFDFTDFTLILTR